MKYSFFALILLLVFGTGCAYHLVPDVQSSSKPTEQASLVDQERCAKDAETYFDKNYSVVNSLPSATTHYTNHVNKQSGKCFIYVTIDYASNDKTFIAYDLIDMLENKDYAEFLYNGIGFKSCTTINGDCSSLAEFNKVVNSYMNN